MGFFLTIMGIFPEIQQKVFEEDQKIQQTLEGRDITWDDLQKYEYTERVIKESMRLFPIGPAIGRKAAEDIDFGKF